MVAVYLEIGDLDMKPTGQQVFFMNYDFEKLSIIVESLRNTSSTLEKEQIIRDNADNDFFRNVLLFTYHPMWKYNLTSEQINKKSDLRNPEWSTENIFQLLDALEKRKITGHNAIGAVNTFIEDGELEPYRDLILCIIDKDLKTRAGDKIINKAIPNLVPTFSVALADKYESKHVKWEDGWYVSRKLDGVRCVAIVDAMGDTTFYTRTGKVIDTLRVVSDGISALGISNTVFDGELCLVDDNGVEDFQGVMKQLNKKDHTIPNPSYKIFDCLSDVEFQSGASVRTLSKRLERLQQAMENNECPCLSVLEQEEVFDDEHFQKWAKRADDGGWEGLMLRKNTSYKGKRSKDLLKVKKFFDAEYEIEGCENGPFRYVKDGAECEETMMSAVFITHKGHKVRVGSGWTIDQRQHYYQNPDELVGSVATIQYFEETKNQKGGISLRFPTLKLIHGKQGRTT
jgi:DNA ligase-1